MRGSFLRPTHLSPILLLGLLAFSTHLLWAQKQLPPEERVVELPDAPAPAATIARLCTPLSFFHPPGCDRQPGNPDAVENQDRRPVPPVTKRTKSAPAYGQVHQETIHDANDLEYYGHRIPWAGPIILRIGQQAKAHPHITTVLKMVHPRF